MDQKNFKMRFVTTLVIYNRFLKGYLHSIAMIHKIISNMAKLFKSTVINS